jgi:hypothetical protein
LGAAVPKSDRQPDSAAALGQKLAELSTDDPDFWTMRQASRRRNGHGLFQYPAMMLPDVQGAILDALLGVDASVNRVLDPYMGSGTVLIESISRGLSFEGTDLNPLAVLIAGVKAHQYCKDALEGAGCEVLEHARRSRAYQPLINAPEAAKWFTPAVLLELTRLRRGIRRIDDVAVRRALWVALAETVRLTSNSRTSTVKLHVLAKESLAGRQVSAFETFETVWAMAERQLAEESQLLATAPTVGDGATVTVCVADARSYRVVMQADVLMTSPPYGDNLTTVTYGQHSWLPLNWIDEADLPAGRMPVSAYQIDRLSLGGQLKNACDATKSLAERSVSFDRCATSVAKGSRNAQQRLAAFFRDLSQSIDSLVPQVRPSGWLVWTLADRHIEGHRIPTTAIVRELLENAACVEVATLTRAIPAGRKRMAPRNNISETMTSESVLMAQRREVASKSRAASSVRMVG